MKRRTFLAAAALARRAATAIEPTGELPWRKVHIDYHNSELIPDLAADFEPREFAATLARARVESVNVCAKCIHGYAYYDTALGVRHPSLKIDLLSAMLAALRQAGIAANYYYVLTWDLLAARRRPEWRMYGRDGNVVVTGRDWPQVCLNSPYFNQVLRENGEILTRYRAAGAWFDILLTPSGGCFCPWCREDRRALKLTDSRADLDKHNKITALRVEERLTALVRAHWPDALVFYNGRTAIGMRDELPHFSHIEIESLPTGGWGYTHFQHRVRYARTLGKQVIGMTGRFHRAWGDFGGLKNQAALDYEVLSMASNGAKVCVGDQLPPRGRLEAPVYARIGRAFERLEALEPYLEGAQAVTDIGVISAMAGDHAHPTAAIDAGFTNMLLELHQQFDVLDRESDISRYAVIVLPDDISPHSELARKLDRYLASGGAVLATHRSMRDWPALGVRHLGPASFAQAYLFATDARLGLEPGYGYFLYQPGSSVEALPGTKTLAVYGDPYFDRSPERFTSHAQTPVARQSDRPLVTLRGRAAYVANPIFLSYATDAHGVCKQVARTLLHQLLPSPTVKASNLPSTAEVTVLRQRDRMLVNLLHYPRTRRSPDIDIIEEPGWLKDVRLAVRRSTAPKQVLLAPSRRPVPFRYRAGYVEFEVTWVEGHQSIALV
jgi:hypothetical protein